MWGNRKNKKEERKRSLQQRTLLLLIILLLFFCTMFLIATFIIRKRTEDDYKIRTSETAVNNVASSIRASLVNYNYISRLLMVNERVLEFLHSENVDKDKTYEAKMGIYDVLNVYSYIDSVYIYRNDGNYVSTGRGEYIIDDIGGAERERILKARGSTVISINGNGTICKKNGKPILTMARAIYDIYSQEQLGVLIINISNDVFDDTLTLQNSGGMCVVDSCGTFLCGSAEVAELFTGEFITDNVIHREVYRNEEKKTLSGIQVTEPLVVLCVNADGTTTLPAATVYALLLMLTAFLASTLVCAWFVTVNIARPIQDLSTAMERTKSSGWLKRIDTKIPNNEIGQLAESYNSMIEYLNELFNRLLENEKNVQKAEMRVLHEQIKPHFLYNSLETISYMAVQENAGRVHDALEMLGSFYRNFLSKGDREISLRRELHITQDYLALQKLRYGDVFEDEYVLDDTTLDYMIPKLILQPLVENCIYHGVRLKGEKGIIRITTRMEEDGLHVIVYDSGVGMTAEQIKEVLVTGDTEEGDVLSGFGLHGTIKRIRYYCDCDEVVQIRSEPGEYTEIEIRIPRMIESGTEGKSDV